MFRRLMMQSKGGQQGLAYETGSITLTESQQAIDIANPFGTDEGIAMIIRLREDGFAGGVNRTYIAYYLTGDLFNNAKLTNQTGVRGSGYACETRTSSATNTWHNPSSSMYVSTTTCHFAGREAMYPFLPGTYDWVIISFYDTSSAKRTRFVEGTFVKPGSGNVIPNTFGTTRLWAFCDIDTPTFSVNGVIANTVLYDIGYRVGAAWHLKFCYETRTTTTSSSIYDANSAKITASSITFGIRNGSYPFQSGTYHYYIIEIPEFVTYERIYPPLSGFRRRLIMANQAKKDNPYKDWIIMRTKNNGTQACIVYNADICSSFIDRMLVDGVEVTPAYNYQFGDSGIHLVMILPKTPTSLPNNCFWTANYTIGSILFPETIETLGSLCLRGLGASQNCDIIWRVLPSSVNTNNNIGNTRRITYVSDGQIDAAKAITGLTNPSEVYNISAYTGPLKQYI